MSIAAIALLVQGFFKFFPQLVALVKLLQATPEQHRERIMQTIQNEAAKTAQTGRPTW